MTRREAAQVYIAAVCSAWVCVMGAGITFVENSRSLDAYFRSQESWRALSPNPGPNPADFLFLKQTLATASSCNTCMVRSQSGVRSVLEPTCLRELTEAAPGLANGSRLENVARSQGSYANAAGVAPRSSNAGWCRGVTPERDPGLAQHPLEPLAKGHSGESFPRANRWTRTLEGGAQGVRSAPMAGEGRHTPTRPSGLAVMAKRAASLCGLVSREDVTTFYRLIGRESGWNPDAISSSGVRGLGQVKPGSSPSKTLDLSHPWGQLLASACHLSDLKQRMGSMERALHAYRLGPRAKATRVSQAYVSDILQGESK